MAFYSNPFEEGLRGLRPRGAHNVEVKLVGEWYKFNDLIKNLKTDIRISAIAGYADFAEDYKDKLVKNIRNGGKCFGYPPNSGEYLRRKAKHGLSTTVLNASGTMAESVEVMPNSTKTKYMVGIREGLSRPQYWPSDEAPLEVHEYANALEHGFEGGRGAIVEARPVFSDTFSKPKPNGMGGKVGLGANITKFITAHFTAKGIRITKNRLF